MEPETKKKIEVPSECSTPDEYKRFEDMARKLISVPKKDIQDREKKNKAKSGKRV